MKHLFLLSLIALAVTSFVGCAAKRNLTSETETDTNHRDSVRIEYRERVITKTDTVTIEIPAQAAERETADSVSHLENDYAVSDARIFPDGRLFHSLAMKPQKVNVPVTVQERERETNTYHGTSDSQSVTKTETKTIEVAKPLTWWQKTQIYGFWAFFVLCAYSYRKNIFSLIVRVFLKK